MDLLKISDRGNAAAPPRAFRIVFDIPSGPELFDLLSPLIALRTSRYEKVMNDTPMKSLDTEGSDGRA
jgi:hypothetical protein